MKMMMRCTAYTKKVKVNWQEVISKQYRRTLNKEDRTSLLSVEDGQFNIPTKSPKSRADGWISQ